MNIGGSGYCREIIGVRGDEGGSWEVITYTKKRAGEMMERWWIAVLNWT